MELSDLRIFCQVAQTQSVTRAAAQLHRVPSNVTTRLRQLEEDIGQALFLRERRGMAITPAGQQLLGYAQRLLDLAQEAHEALQDNTPRGRLRLGAMESTAAVRLPAPLAEYHRRYPLVAMELRTGPSHALLTQVLDGDLDAALVADPTPHERLVSAPAFTEELLLVADAGHRKIRSPDDVAQATLLGFGAGCSYRRKLEDWYRAGATGPHRLVELSSYHAILACAVAGMGVALVPRALLELFPQRAGLSCHPLPAALRHSRTCLVWRKGTDTPKVQALAHMLRLPKKAQA